MSIYTLIAVGTGGLLGSITRFLTAQWVDQRLNSHFPYGTLTVNIAGSFVLGLIVGLSLRHQMNVNWRLFLSTGFCGGFTTFSAFAFENMNLVHEKLFSTAFVYILVTLVGGLLAVGLGVWAGRAIH